VAANGTHIGLAQPVIMNGRKGNKATGVDAAPIPTLDTKGGVWLAEPLILSNQNSGAPRSTDEPVPTITTGGAGSPRQGCARPMLVQPFILSRQSCGAPRTTDEPMPTQTTVHSPVLIAPYYGTGSGETCNSAEEPLPTVTSKGRFGMVVPVTHAGGLDRARHIETPLPTVTGANRGELAFITAQFGERDGQAPRVHDLDEPAPVGVTLGNGLLIEPTRDFDILFRMLEPHELAAAMGFNTEGTKYEFAGTKTEQIKQIGNAVCVSMMKAEVKAILADAVPKRKQKPEPMRVAAE
jgi:DNA (cytosine-5)-methyltransferase 1